MNIPLANYQIDFAGQHMDGDLMECFSALVAQKRFIEILSISGKMDAPVDGQPGHHHLLIVKTFTDHVSDVSKVHDHPGAIVYYSFPSSIDPNDIALSALASLPRMLNERP